MLRHEIGLDRIAFETHYPHSDSSFPDTQILLGEQLRGIPEEEAARMTWQNAADLYRHEVSPSWGNRT